MSPRRKGASHGPPTVAGLAEVHKELFFAWPLLFICLFGALPGQPLTGVTVEVLRADNILSELLWSSSGHYEAYFLQRRLSSVPDNNATLSHNGTLLLTKIQGHLSTCH